MNNDDKILVGKIVAPQGIKGEFRVQSFAASATDFKNFKIISDKFEAKQFHFVRTLKSDLIVAALDNVNDRNAAESLRGTQLFVLRKDLPQLNDNEYYQSDLLGFSVLCDGDQIGLVECFHNFGAGDIIEMNNGEMVAFKDVTVNLKNKTITINK